MTDTEKIGLMGHSLGGAAAVSVGKERSDIDAVIDMDGSMFGEMTNVKDGKFEYYTGAYPARKSIFKNHQQRNGYFNAYYNQ